MNNTTQNQDANPKANRKPLTDQEKAMLAAPVFEPDWILPVWFNEIGGWASAGIKW